MSASDKRPVKKSAVVAVVLVLFVAGRTNSTTVSFTTVSVIFMSVLLTSHRVSIDFLLLLTLLVLCMSLAVSG